MFMLGDLYAEGLVQIQERSGGKDLLINEFCTHT